MTNSYFRYSCSLIYRLPTSLWRASLHFFSAKLRIRRSTTQPLRSPCQRDQAWTAWRPSYGSQHLTQFCRMTSYIASRCSANTLVRHQYPQVMLEMERTTTGLIGGRVWLRRSGLLSIADDCNCSSRRYIVFPRRWMLVTSPFADNALTYYAVRTRGLAWHT